MSRLSLPALVAVIAGAVLVALLLILQLTQADRGLRIESAAQPTGAAGTPRVTEGPEPLFTLDEVRSHLLDADAPDAAIDAEFTEILLYCNECLEQGATLTIDEQPFQVVLLTEPGTESVVAGAVIGEESGQPRTHLVVSGQDLSLTPGRGGTLVAQEPRFTAADEACCPTGWSVQVYRFHDGRFEAGQRISSTGVT